MSARSVAPLAEARRAPGRPRDGRVDRAIADAVLRQLDDLGYAGLSMESVACEAGVARATVYRRFADKADLVTAVVAANAGGRFDDVPSADPRADLVRYLEEFDERFGDSCIEVIGTLLASRGDRSALALHRERIVAPRTAHLRSLLARGQALGLLDEDLDVDLAVQMLAGSVFARRVAGAPTAPRWARRAVDMVWAEPRAT